MIKPGEIQQKAREVGVRDQQIEKDYILSWILKGVSQHDQLSKIIVFKGGTVLKKIYFPEANIGKKSNFLPMFPRRRQYFPISFQSARYLSISE